MTFTFFSFTRITLLNLSLTFGRLSQSDSLDPHFLAYGITKESDMTERLSLAAENRFEVYQTVPHGISI